MGSRLSVLPRKTRLEVVTDSVTWRVPAPLAAIGLGSLALAHLVSRDGLMADGGGGTSGGRFDLRPRAAHFTPRCGVQHHARVVKGQED